MYKALSPGAVRVSTANLEESLAAAKTGGFDGVEFNPSEIADLVEQQGAEAVRGRFAEAGIRPAGWGMPVDWRGSDENWQAGLSALPRLAQAAAAIGGVRVSTWVMPCSQDRPFDENYQFHVTRFQPIARILGDHGIALGLEFIGPKTLRQTQKHPFIYTLEAMLALGRDIGPNVGLLLDCWHWYTSHGTLDSLQMPDARPGGLCPCQRRPGGRPRRRAGRWSPRPARRNRRDQHRRFPASLKSHRLRWPCRSQSRSKKELADLPSDEAQAANGRRGDGQNLERGQTMTIPDSRPA